MTVNKIFWNILIFSQLWHNKCGIYFVLLFLFWKWLIYIFLNSFFNLLVDIYFADALFEKQGSFIFSQWASLAQKNLVGFAIIVLLALLRCRSWIFMDVPWIVHRWRTTISSKKIYQVEYFGMCHWFISIINGCYQAWLYMIRLIFMIIHVWSAVSMKKAATWKNHFHSTKVHSCHLNWFLTEILIKTFLCFQNFRCFRNPLLPPCRLKETIQ